MISICFLDIPGLGNNYVVVWCIWWKKFFLNISHVNLSRFVSRLWYLFNFDMFSCTDIVQLTERLVVFILQVEWLCPVTIWTGILLHWKIIRISIPSWKSCYQSCSFFFSPWLGITHWKCKSGKIMAEWKVLQLMTFRECRHLKTLKDCSIQQLGHG